MDVRGGSGQLYDRDVSLISCFLVHDFSKSIKTAQKHNESLPCSQPSPPFRFCTLGFSLRSLLPSLILLLLIIPQPPSRSAQDSSSSSFYPHSLFFSSHSSLLIQHCLLCFIYHISYQEHSCFPSFIFFSSFHELLYFP